MSRSDIIKCEVANAIVMQLWVKNLISTEERDKIIEIFSFGIIGFFSGLSLAFTVLFVLPWDGQDKIFYSK